MGWNFGFGRTIIPDRRTFDFGMSCDKSNDCQIEDKKKRNQKIDEEEYTYYSSTAEFQQSINNDQNDDGLTVHFDLMQTFQKT